MLHKFMHVLIASVCTRQIKLKSIKLICYTIRLPFSWGVSKSLFCVHTALRVMGAYLRLGRNKVYHHYFTIGMTLFLSAQR